MQAKQAADAEAEARAGSLPLSPQNKMSANKKMPQNGSPAPKPKSSSFDGEDAEDPSTIRRRSIERYHERMAEEAAAEYLDGLKMDSTERSVSPEAGGGTRSATPSPTHRDAEKSRKRSVSINLDEIEIKEIQENLKMGKAKQVVRKSKVKGANS